MKRTRKSKARKPKKLIVLLCEGSITEPTYFRRIFASKEANRFAYSLTAYQPEDHSPLGIVKRAKVEKASALRDKIPAEDFSVWAVFDRNGHSEVATAFAMAKANGIDIVFSSICFEFWILLHYCRTMKPFSNCSELIDHLRQHHDNEYDKASDCFVRLKDRICQAIENGKWVEGQVRNDLERGTKIYDLNPYTNAHQLVEFLLNL